MTAAIALGVAWWIRKEEQRGDQLALAMVLGGALGNIVDRVRFGYVVDFLDLHFGTFRPFYVFNVGDAAISIGVVILLLRAFLLRDKAPEGTNRTCVRLSSSSPRRSCLPAAASFGGTKHKSLDEFAVARNAPLVIPPDYSLTPPVAGTVSMTAAGRADPGDRGTVRRPCPAQRDRNVGCSSAPAATVRRVGVRSTAGDPDTRVVDKGQSTQAIIAAPQADTAEASAQTPQQ